MSEIGELLKDEMVAFQKQRGLIKEAPKPADELPQHVVAAKLRADVRDVETTDPLARRLLCTPDPPRESDSPPRRGSSDGDDRKSLLDRAMAEDERKRDQKRRLKKSRQLRRLIGGGPVSE